MGLEASENPFDLKTNLKSLDEEQSSLISELRESTGNKDDFLLDEEIESFKEKKGETLQPSDQNISSQEIKEKPSKAEPSKEETVEEKKPEKTELPEKIPTKDIKKTTPVEKPLKKEDKTSVEALKTVDENIAEKEKQAEDERLKALEEERIAVQKYEAERLRKKQAEEAAKEKSEKKDTQADSKETLKTQKDEEEAMIEKAIEKAKKEVNKSQEKQDANPQKKAEPKSAFDDINLTLEQKRAKEEADRLYLEAIKEMDAK
jgi:hypothetical protein